ncbi:hypothetical protein NMG60_11003912 [Bertholletia excelsa]
MVLVGVLEASPREFWMENGEGWGSYTLLAILFIFTCQLAGTTWFWLVSRSPSPSPSPILSSSSSSSFFPNCRLEYAAAFPRFTDDSKKTVLSPSIRCQISISDIISDLDLKNLIDNLDENSFEFQKWESVIDRRNNLLTYSAKCCKPKDSPLKYVSITIFENCTAEMLRDFYMDNCYRKKWDKTLIAHEQLEIDESNGTEIGRIIKKFPLLTAREYILAWRVWESKNGTFYCFSKECEHPLAPRQKKHVRVVFFRSGWQIRKVPGRNACEIKMVHQEDAGLNVEMAKLVFAKGIWSYVCKMGNALREYSTTNSSLSSLGTTAISHIQKVPAELDFSASMPNPACPETSETSVSSYHTVPQGCERKLSRKPSTTLIANGLLLLGGVICMSRGHSNLGAKVAIAYILTKLTMSGASYSQTGQA